MIWRIEIKNREGVSDPSSRSKGVLPAQAKWTDAQGKSVEKSILDLGIKTVSRVRTVFVYNIEGQLIEEQIKRVAQNLLVNPVTQSYHCQTIEKFQKPKTSKNFHVVEIAHNIGVMDPVEESTIKGIRDLGITQVKAVRATKQYLIEGTLTDKQIKLITDKVLSNKLIQHVVDYDKKPKTFLISSDQSKFDLILIDLLKADSKKLMEISRKGQLFLNLDEMKAIQKYFKKQQRNPTDAELETIAQTWSEHCYHKTFRGNIEYQYKENGKTRKKLIRNLLKSTIAKATYEINKSWCVSVFHDNAGVIKFDQDTHVCFKAETHNHPSALEPYGGANTGIGGVIRDILGTGLGAKPICCTDVFCFAPPDLSLNELPAGTLHPKRIMKGVVSGVRDYGNKMGIPTVNGAILFDRKFVGNPLVYCGNIGLLPKDKVIKKVSKGDKIVAVGGKTGRDGIHGATFSSGELTDESEVVSSGAVQIGDPIQEKKVLDALLQARDQNLYSAITDCGAGGFSSAVGEMGSKTGARVDLDLAPLKYKGLNYHEIWISESQERMVLSVPAENVEKLLALFSQENVEATMIGEFTGNGRLELYFNGIQVCDLDMEFLHEGNPKITKKATWAPGKVTNPRISEVKDLTENLFKVLSHYNVCSKEWVIRQYDHEVQGSSVIKPLVGVQCDGPSDASVLAPKLGSLKGIAVSNGINVRFGMIDPYWMAASCIDEAIRQIISVGGDVDKIAILDNFCWGNPDKPDRLGSLVRAAEGCYKTSVGYQVPFISGKDSLYNEFNDGGKSIAIPGTLLISAIGIIEDVSKTVTMDFKKAGNLIYVIGDTFDELGGSIYLDTLGHLGADVPKVNTVKGLKIFQVLSSAVKKGLVRSIHDCSEGGLAVSLAEMAFSGNIGAVIDLNKVPYKGREKQNNKILFSESNTRFVVEIEPEHQKGFEKTLKDISFAQIGETEAADELVVYGTSHQKCIHAQLKELKEAWQSPLRW